MDLQNVIDKAATRFATEVMEAIRSVPLSELLEERPDAAPVVAKKRMGRPKKVAVVKPAKKAPKTALPKAKKTKKHSYPKCSVPGCKNTMWARGEGMCGEHFKAKHEAPVVAKLLAKKPKKAKPPKKVKAPKTPKPAKVAKPKKEPKSRMAPMGRDAAIAKNAAAETPKE
jgi:hypothetical protein